jgi:hypothetical protein
VSLWSGFTWIRIGSSSGEHNTIINILVSQALQRLSVSQEGFSYVELVNQLGGTSAVLIQFHLRF